MPKTSNDCSLNIKNIESTNISTNIEEKYLNSRENSPRIKPKNQIPEPSNPHTRSFKYERFSDIVTRNSLVSLPNPEEMKNSVGQKKKKFVKRKGSFGVKKEEEKTERDHKPIMRYFRKEKPCIFKQGKRKVETTENANFKKLKVGTSD